MKHLNNRRGRSYRAGSGNEQIDPERCSGAHGITNEACTVQLPRQQARPDTAAMQQPRGQHEPDAIGQPVEVRLLGSSVGVLEILIGVAEYGIGKKLAGIVTTMDMLKVIAHM